MCKLVKWIFSPSFRAKERARKQLSMLKKRIKENKLVQKMNIDCLMDLPSPLQIQWFKRFLQHCTDLQLKNSNDPEYPKKIWSTSECQVCLEQAPSVVSSCGHAAVCVNCDIQLIWTRFIVNLKSMVDHSMIAGSEIITQEQIVKVLQMESLIKSKENSNSPQQKTHLEMIFYVCPICRAHVTQRYPFSN
jgi:hypothetical protein